MSSPLLELLEKIKTKFTEVASDPEKRSKITASDISQYNVTVDGKVAHTVVFNLKDFVLSEEATANDIEITISAEDVVALYQNKVTLVELKEAVSFYQAVVWFKKV